jgi:hypothetical protein
MSQNDDQAVQKVAEVLYEALPLFLYPNRTPNTMKYIEYIS